MVRTQIYLPDDLHRELKLIAVTQNINLSQLIREGAKKEIKARMDRSGSESWREFAGAWKGGPKDASERINEIYK